MTIKQTTILTNGQFTLALINNIINYKCILSVLGNPYPRLDLSGESNNKIGISNNKKPSLD